MDSDPATVVGVLKEMKSAGKAVVGMKILGQGALRTRQDEAIKYALSLGILDAFTIGAESKQEQEDLIRRIAAALEIFGKKNEDGCPISRAFCAREVGIFNSLEFRSLTLHHPQRRTHNQPRLGSPLHILRR
jgi:hypothetical protein